MRSNHRGGREVIAEHIAGHEARVIISRRDRSKLVSESLPAFRTVVDHPKVMKLVTAVRASRHVRSFFPSRMKVNSFALSSV